MSGYTESQERLVLDLLADGRWRKAKQITKMTGIHGVTIRAISSQTGKIIGCVKNGYRLTVKASPDELLHHTKSLQSRMNAMRQHIANVDRVLFEKVQRRIS